MLVSKPKNVTAATAIDRARVHYYRDERAGVSMEIRYVLKPTNFIINPCWQVGEGLNGEIEEDDTSYDVRKQPNEGHTIYKTHKTTVNPIATPSALTCL